jgi:hypothetical protein
MKRTLYLFVSLTVFSLLLISASFAQDNMDQSSDQQKAWMEYMTPGPSHELLATNAGEWKTSAKFWMNPGDEPSLSEGTATGEMVLGGRYLKFSYSSNVMNMPMEGMSLDAFDNASKEFINVWIDNMGTGVLVARGTYDEETKTINYKGSFMDPMSGKEMNFRETMEFVDDNTRHMEMFMIMDDGSEFKSMEVDYVKKS